MNIEYGNMNQNECDTDLCIVYLLVLHNKQGLRVVSIAIL